MDDSAEMDITEDQACFNLEKPRQCLAFCPFGEDMGVDEDEDDQDYATSLAIARSLSELIPEEAREIDIPARNDSEIPTSETATHEEDHGSSDDTQTKADELFRLLLERRGESIKDIKESEKKPQIGQLDHLTEFTQQELQNRVQNIKRELAETFKLGPDEIPPDNVLTPIAKTHDPMQIMANIVHFHRARKGHALDNKDPCCQLEHGQEHRDQGLIGQGDGLNPNLLELADDLKLLRPQKKKYCTYPEKPRDSSIDIVQEEKRLQAKENNALRLMEQGKYKESLKISEEVHQSRARFSREDIKSSTLNLAMTRSDMAKATLMLGDYERSVILYDLALKDLRGWSFNHPITLDCELNQGLLFKKMGEIEKAVSKFVSLSFRSRAAYGADDDRTLFADSELAKAYLGLNDVPLAIKIFTDVLATRERILGKNHPKVLKSHARLAALHSREGRHADAIRTLHQCFEKQNVLLGGEHPDTRYTLSEMESIVRLLGKEKSLDLFKSSTSPDEVLELYHLIESGDIEIVRKKLKLKAALIQIPICKGTYISRASSMEQAQVGGKDSNQREGVEVDLTRIPVCKSQTTLHCAVESGNLEMTECLLEYANQTLKPYELIDFIDAKIISPTGNTAIHIAAIRGFLKLVKTLLRYGATYNITNSEGLTPYEKTEDPTIRDYLVFIDELFAAIRHEQLETIDKLKELEVEDRLAAINARDFSTRLTGGCGFLIAPATDYEFSAYLTRIQGYREPAPEFTPGARMEPTLPYPIYYSVVPKAKNTDRTDHCRRLLTLPLDADQEVIVPTWYNGNGQIFRKFACFTPR